MKELSIEQKAKAYDEALEIARQYWNDRAMPIGTNFKLERMFPELKESEDERIRKAIVKMISDIDGGSPFEKYGIIKKEALAWLEKQGEKKLPIEKLPFEIKTTEESLGIDSDTYSKIVDECIYGEQKPAWSEENEKMLDYALDMIEWYGGKNEDKSRLVSGWLKSLKDRIQPQPKQEWSEEDDEHLERILKELESQRQRPFNRPYLDKIESDYNWLKSLRPQSQWKPTDEQMETLKSSTYCQNEQMSKVLFELYQDLKKLREK